MEIQLSHFFSVGLGILTSVDQGLTPGELQSFTSSETGPQAMRNPVFDKDCGLMRP